MCEKLNEESLTFSEPLSRQISKVDKTFCMQLQYKDSDL